MLLTHWKFYNMTLRKSLQIVIDCDNYYALITFSYSHAHSWVSWASAHANNDDDEKKNLCQQLAVLRYIYLLWPRKNVTLNANFSRFWITALLQQQCSCIHIHTHTYTQRFWFTKWVGHFLKKQAKTNFRFRKKNFFLFNFF